MPDIAIVLTLVILRIKAPQAEVLPPEEGLPQMKILPPAAEMLAHLMMPGAWIIKNVAHWKGITKHHAILYLHRQTSAHMMTAFLINASANQI